MELLLSPFEPAMLGPHHDLFVSYFPAGDKLLQENYLRWLYEKNPHGPALMVRVVEDCRWIAFMAMIPVRLNCSERQRQAYYVVNVLVHPEHQGRYLFGRMIGAAAAYCQDIDCWLMGHPNTMALPAWRRARMQFRPALNLRLITPGISLGIGGRRELSSLAQLQQCLSMPENDIMARNNTPLWKPVCTAEYLFWRFLNHPVNQYRINLLCQRGGQSLLCVTKRIKPGVHLMIESWSSSASLQAAGACAPWLTVAAITDEAQMQSKGGVLSLSLRKSMPFFCTSFSTSLVDNELSALSLAASDF
jgi:GNAT superfamily N-acetyltransferase